MLNVCIYIWIGLFWAWLVQSVPAALGRLKVGLVCGKPQGEVAGCMLHAPLLGPGYTPAVGLARHQQASVEAGDLV